MRSAFVGSLPFSLFSYAGLFRGYNHTHRLESATLRVGTLIVREDLTRGWVAVWVPLRAASKASSKLKMPACTSEEK
jgi:hypothetical protein